jgi:hypothetical protein
MFWFLDFGFGYCIIFDDWSFDCTLVDSTIYVMMFQVSLWLSLFWLWFFKLLYSVVSKSLLLQTLLRENEDSCGLILLRIKLGDEPWKWKFHLVYHFESQIKVKTCTCWANYMVLIKRLKPKQAKDGKLKGGRLLMLDHVFLSK